MESPRIPPRSRRRLHVIDLSINALASGPMPLKRFLADSPKRTSVTSTAHRIEIVLAEESDLDLDGNPAGHLDMYLKAMDDVGADTSGFRAFLAKLSMGRSVTEALNGVRARRVVQDFVATTMDIAENGSTVEVASAFLRGREDPIPLMFERLLGQLATGGVVAPRFAYYLERHIELDGGSHGPMGEQLLERLISGDPVLERASNHTAARAMTARIRFWSGIEHEIECLRGRGYREMMGV